MTIRDVRIIKCFFEMDCDLLRSLFEVARGMIQLSCSSDCVHARDVVVHFGGSSSKASAGSLWIACVAPVCTSAYVVDTRVSHNANAF